MPRYRMLASEEKIEQQSQQQYSQMMQQAAQKGALAPANHPQVIRLRNIAGLIVIDFIHMEDGRHWEAVIELLRQVAARDRNATRVLGATHCWLVEITLRRRREPLLHSVTELCRLCGGTGRIRSLDAVSMDVLRALNREARVSPPGRLVLYAAADVVDSLENGYSEAVAAVGAASGRTIALRAEAGYGREGFDIVVE